MQNQPKKTAHVEKNKKKTTINAFCKIKIRKSDTYNLSIFFSLLKNICYKTEIIIKKKYIQINDRANSPLWSAGGVMSRCSMLCLFMHSVLRFHHFFFIVFAIIHFFF